VTASGVWSQRYLRWAIEVLGIDRIMFSTDYPYRFTRGGGAHRFLEEADLSHADKAAIANGNWERLARR
jgi:predicted TIM-barrel fold metal-dependent hydrolase